MTLKILTNRRMKTLFKILNNLNDQNDDDSTGVNCKYYQIDEFQRKLCMERQILFFFMHLCPGTMTTNTQIQLIQIYSVD